MNRQYDKDRVLEILRLTLVFLRKDPDKVEYQNIHEIKKKLEQYYLRKVLGKKHR